MSDSSDGFYFDLASPHAYLAAEHILQALPRPLEWQPVLARELAGAESFEAFRCAGELEAMRDGVERRARELGLQPLRWPDPFPFDSSLAMRAATYAKSIGRVVPFAQAAFRQAFAGGHALDDPDVVLIAAAACEMHPAAVLRGVELRSVTQQLTDATHAAGTIQINEIPAVVVDHQLFAGERFLERAAEQMRAAQSAGAAAGARRG